MQLFRRIPIMRQRPQAQTMHMILARFGYFFLPDRPICEIIGVSWAVARGIGQAIAEIDEFDVCELPRKLVKAAGVQSERTNCWG